MTDRELMQQALEALENGGHMTINIAAAALRERLAQPEPWEQFYPDMGKPHLSLAQPEQALEKVAEHPDGTSTWKVAPQRREWVGLTDKEVREWWASENGMEDCDMCKLDDFTQVARAIEAKLKEKNA
jgi:hypothetical protein